MDISKAGERHELTAEGSERLDVFLARMLPGHSRSKLVRAIDAGDVLVDGLPRRRAFRLEGGMSVCLPEPVESEPHDLTPVNIPLEICFEDDVLLVVNKPRGLAVHPAPSLKQPSLVNALLARSHSLSRIGRSFRPGIVHRLDKDTTGLILVAKTEAAHVSLARQIERKQAHRRYVAIVAGKPSEQRFCIDAPIARDPRNRLKMSIQQSGKAAVTHVKRLRVVDAGTLVAVKLETGRTHQIRVHLSAIGHPIVGDKIYAPHDLRQAPMQLHAALLGFAHPTSGKAIEVYVSPPLDFLAQVQRADVEEL